MKSEKDLHREVLQELEWEPSVNPAHIGVSVKESIVTLSGHVSSYWEKYSAEKAVKRVSGVKAVVNELEVRLPGSSQRTDEDVARTVLKALEDSIAVPHEKIRVTISKGWVTLEGEVEWQYQKVAAESAIRRFRRRFAALLRLGVPAAGMLLFEGGAFVATALMMGWLGTVPLAAHQIAIGCASLAFMFPLGLSLAVSLRISRAQGEGRGDALRPIGFGALLTGLVIMVGFALAFALAGRGITAAFTPAADVAALAAQLLVVAAFFQLFDGGQVISAGALRGLHDVRVPTVITFIAYWVISLPLGYGLAFHTPLGAVGLWTGLAAGLGCAALLLGWRFHRLTQVH